MASDATLIQRLKKGRYKFDLVIFYEAHHVVAGNKWGRVYERLGRPPMLGVNATPVHTDGKGLGEHAGGCFKSMVEGPTVVRRKMLLDPTSYTSLNPPDMTGVKKDKDGNYNRTELAARVDKPKVIGDAVSHYTQICPGARAMMFCASVEHAKHAASLTRPGTGSSSWSARPRCRTSS